MQLPKSGTVTLKDILITQELPQRSSRSPNWQAENQAMRTLARQLAAPASMLQNLVDTALNLCQAGTAGISVLETTPDGEEVFRAHALAGMAQHVGSTAKHNSIFCGVCLDGLELSKADCSPFQLFSYPDRYFTYLQSVNTPIVEALVLPLIADYHALGTLWILAHDEQRHFDLEDVRVMTLLADFAAAHLWNQRQTQQLLAANARLEAIANTSAYESGRKREEQALRKSEEKYRTLFNSMDQGYCVIEMHIEPGEPLDYRFIETNQAFEQQSTLINAQGKWMRELRPNHEESWFEIYRNVALTGEPIRFEHGGRELGDRWFTLYAFRVGQPDERRVAVLFNDITERKRAEAAMRAFFSNVSHEFRTPLTLLQSSIQETLSDRAHPLTPTQQSQLQLAHRNAIRLLKLVNTLLDFSRIEAGRIQAVYEPTDLATLTIELASAFESAIEQAGLRLVIDCPPLRSPVYVERSMWEKIVFNLLSNAFKFTFAGEIAVRLTLAGNSVELTVQDTGIGIAAAELPRLFERFYQVKGVKGRSFEGSGIGLSLVQELVLLHGGTIAVSSVEGEGSCFKVSIPTGFAHLPPEQIGSSQTLPSTATGVTAYVEEALGWLPEEAVLPPIPSAPLLRTARILLVDDNADMRRYLKRILSQRWQVETAANGALALNLIQQQPPDLVLTDVMMPQLDGLQLLQALRADPQTKSIPIILLSARAGEEATIEGLEALADDYLIKPCSARELLTRIETHLELARLRFERSTNRFKNEFLLTVTHELQSPLASILGWTRLLQSKTFDSDKTARALATIERNATIEAKLIKDLLDVSAILSGKLRLKSQVVDLVALVQNVMATFRAAAGAKRIQLVETISDEVQRNVFADGDRLRQVIANLLDNAIKFTPSGGIVKIQVERLDSKVKIAVSDTGRGIRPDFLPLVFERFTQAEVPSRHTPGGVGIGLAIARHLVELHKGTIEAASDGEGQGATFTLLLPFVASAELNDSAQAGEQ